MAGGQAIDGKRGTHFWVLPETLIVIGYHTKDGPEHVLWTPEAPNLVIDEEMVNSIDTFAVKEPIGVRKDGDDLQVVKGRHRTINAVEANKRRKARGEQPRLVPVVIVKGEDRDMLLEVQIENSCRVDRSPMDRAREAKRLLDNHVGEATAARSMGLSAVEFDQHLKLFDLATPLQQAVHKRQLSLSAAVKLAKLPREAQLKTFKEAEAAGGKVTVKKARAAVAKKNGRSSASAAPGKRQLKLIVAQFEQGKTTISHDFIRGLQFAMGELESMNVTGLDAALLAIEKAKAGIIAEGEAA